MAKEEKEDREELEVDPMMLELQSTSDFFEENGEEVTDEIYDYYQKAISRRDREPLESDRFFNHFFGEGSSEDNYMFGDQKKGYILGVIRHGVFIPTHFAPKGLRGGYTLMKDLGGSDIVPSVMAITDDLAETLKKMPEWHDSEMTFPMYFRGELHQKFIFYNNHPKIKELLPLLMEDYINESRNIQDDYYDEGEE